MKYIVAEEEFNLSEFSRFFFLFNHCYLVSRKACALILKLAEINSCKFLFIYLINRSFFISMLIIQRYHLENSRLTELDRGSLLWLISKTQCGRGLASHTQCFENQTTDITSSRIEPWIFAYHLERLLRLVHMKRC